MNQSKFRLSTQEAWRKDDDWSEVQEKEERKKRQNRLNQRAYRRRNGPKEPASGKQRNFRVERFRVTEVSPPIVVNKLAAKPATESVSTADKSKPDEATSTAGTLAIRQHVEEEYADYRESHTGSQSNILPEPLETNAESTEAILFRLSKLSQESSQLTQATTEGRNLDEYPQILFPFSSDHLLHLIHYNVYRALITNKIILRTATVQKKEDFSITLSPFHDLCDGLTLIHLKGNDPLPPSLIPTHTQMTISHTAWLNMFPYPQLRDNLIRHQHDFSHLEFCNDLWGEFYFWNLLGFQFSSTDCPINSTGAQNDEFVDDLASGKKGLIVWGESWDLNGWEVTEGFVNKWSWVLEGCIDLIVSSNFWRAKRDLGPLEYPFPRISEEVD